MLKVSLILIAVFAALGIAVTQLGNETAPATNSLRVAEAMSGSDTVGYSRAVEQIDFEFPRDHGPHPDFKTEWWYYTGNLDSKSGRRFGYQFTIFRIALTPTPEERASDWAASQMYMAHFALSDIDGNEFYSFERFSRGAQELAGAQAAPFRVWLEDWEAVDAEGSQPLFPVHHLRAGQDNVAIDFRLQSSKPLVFQGENGLSQKSWERGNASYYYSMTRLKTAGT
ncbi:MAG: carotenoid 1,2-hydratase, partial [Calditrichota bacterium]